MDWKEKQALLKELREKNGNLHLIKDEDIFYAWSHYSIYANCFDIGYFLDQYLDIPECHHAG